MENRTSPYTAPTTQLREAQNRLATLRDIESGLGSTSALNGVAGVKVSDPGEAQRARLLATTDKLHHQCDRIRESRQLLAQTEELGMGILGELHSQRETMVNVRANLMETDDHISRGRRALATMAKRAVTNKAILYIIILGLVGVIGFIFFAKFRRVVT